MTTVKIPEGVEIIIGGSRYFACEAVSQHLCTLAWQDIHTRFPMLRRPMHWQKIGNEAVPFFTLEGMRQLHDAMGLVSGFATARERLADWLGLPKPLPPSKPKPKTVEDEIEALRQEVKALQEAMIPVKHMVREAGLNLVAGKGLRANPATVAAAHRRKDEIAAQLYDAQQRLGALQRKQKMGMSLAANGERGRRFIDAAREVLPKELYMAIWDRVAQMTPAAPTSEGKSA